MLPDDPRAGDELRKFFDLSRDVREFVNWIETGAGSIPAPVMDRARELRDSLVDR